MRSSFESPVRLISPSGCKSPMSALVPKIESFDLQVALISALQPGFQQTEQELKTDLLREK